MGTGAGIRAGFGSNCRASPTMRASAPLCALANREKTVNQSSRLGTAGASAEVIVKETKSLCARQEASNSTIEMNQVEHSPLFGDLRCPTEILEIDEIDRPPGAIATR